MMTKRILLIDDVHEIIPTQLTARGFVVDDGTRMSRSELLHVIGGYQGIVIRSRILVDKEFIDAAPELRFVARVGAGMESIDTEYCSSRGIACLNSPEGNRDAVGEHTVGMLLCLLNNLCRANREVKAGIWRREANRGTELNDKTVAIIGYGNMGGSVARKLSGFGCKVIAYDKYKTGFSDSYATEVSLQSVFQHADIVTLHVPLNASSQKMVNTDFINAFAKPIILINTARGQVVDTAAVVAAMKKGKITAAAFDVFESENPSFETTQDMLNNSNFRYLKSNDNIIFSPHIAGWTHESKIKLASVLVEKILKLYEM